MQNPAFPSFLKWLVLATFVFSASACSQLSTHSSSKKPVASSSKNQPVKTSNKEADNGTSSTDEKIKQAAKRPKGSFDEETLYELLTAEIAAQKGMYAVTLKNYVDAAKRTQNVDIIKRAVRIAEFLKASNAQLMLAKLWAKAEPDKVAAHQLAAFQYAKQKDYENAILEMEKVLNLGGKSDLDRLAVNAKLLPDQDQARLLALFAALAKRHPQNDVIAYSLATLQEYGKHFQEAETTLAPVLKRSPEYIDAIILQGRILYDLKRVDEAASLFKKSIKHFPNNRKLKTFYAGLLIDQKKLDEAEQAFKELMEQYPDTPGLKLSYALVASENHHPEIAKKQLQMLLDEDIHPDEAHYYLGRIAEEAKQPEEAIKQYYQVDSGTHFYSAISRASFLMNKLGKLNDALIHFDKVRNEHPNQSETLWEVEIDLLLTINNQDAALTELNRAIENFPNNDKLRYSRAMIYGDTGKFAKMESEMRLLIKKNPNNSMALNALGYMLADKTKRLDEAYKLIEKAHKLRPKNPAILDSVGWVNYKMGNLLVALDFLERAYKNFPDPEVAAHLGEVLWVTGNHKRALEIWGQGLKKKERHPFIQEAMKRLGAEHPKDQKANP